MTLPEFFKAMQDELFAMMTLDMNVPKGAVSYLNHHRGSLFLMYPSMSISEIADYVCGVAK